MFKKREDVWWSIVNCEICGRIIYGPSSKVVVDGAKLTVCNKCAGYGKVYWEPVITSRNIDKQRRSVPRIRRKTEPHLESFEIVENYGLKIREARERLGLNQEELAKLAKERLSIIQKLEAEKIYPEIRLAKVLEHILKIKLIATEVESKVNAPTPQDFKGLTIGDIISFKKGSTSRSKK